MAEAKKTAAKKKAEAAVDEKPVEETPKKAKRLRKLINQPKSQQSQPQQKLEQSPTTFALLLEKLDLSLIKSGAKMSKSH